MSSHGSMAQNPYSPLTGPPRHDSRTHQMTKTHCISLARPRAKPRTPETDRAPTPESVLVNAVAKEAAKEPKQQRQDKKTRSAFRISAPTTFHYCSLPIGARPKDTFDFPIHRHLKNRVVATGAVQGAWATRRRRARRSRPASGGVRTGDLKRGDGWRKVFTQVATRGLFITLTRSSDRFRWRRRDGEEREGDHVRYVYFRPTPREYGHEAHG
ncbi:hypothetical protein DFH09DRAFT_626899 [Mycena vulgaris]|nr:hypothetical protein DFH09DRAFT_626899 [Mycena vulgaris]